MATTISNGESGLSVRNKLNDIWHSLDLNEIAATISDTAVDVFVYDTRKDSDGGAWRKRTQHTSWYNETLNTATRGSRKEFPSVAVIVAETAQVTIYDGDDPDLPMWMVFNNTGYGAATGSCNGVVAFNGEIVTSNGAGSLREIFFITDTWQYRAGSVYKSNGSQFLSDRNTNATAWVNQGYGGIVNSTTNDVAMTVLPNAPIDAATGLPVPTIAVATDGGVSVIKDDGTVVDSSLTIGISSVSFTENNALVYNRTDLPGSAGDPVQVQLTIPTADGFTADQVFDSAAAPASNKWNNPDVVGLPDDDFAVGSGTTNIGFNYISNEVNNKTSGMTVQVTSGFNSGWQNGDIKLATLSDTDATNVTGSELVTNGTFDTDTSGWTGLSGGSLSVDTGRLKITETTGAVDAYAVNNSAIPTVVGKKYVISWEFEKGTNTGFSVRFGNSGQQTFEYKANINNEYTADGYYSFQFTATTTELWLSFIVNEASTYGFVDNISVRLAEEDRSVNGNGLQVFGTVTKLAVATGADLVSYRANANGAGLVQPHNTDLEFGTGDFCFMFWGKQDTSTTVSAKFLSLGATNSAGTVWVGSNINIDVNNVGLVKVYITDDAYATSDQIELNADGNDGNWYCYALVRRGNTFYGYKNGKLNESVVVSNASGSLSNTDSRICVLIDPRRVAGNTGYGSQTEVEIALLRVSATAPSPEQIKKIYEDEKVLFQENAQATLYGSSDAVTALAYDDSTNLLHVGTSAGRSVFQGLKRVDNTTTAVGAAISASNGLVADE